MNIPSPSSDLKTKILRDIEAHPSPPRTVVSKMSRGRVGVAILVSFVIFAACGGIRVAGRPPLLALGTFLGTALLTGAALWVLAYRGKSMHGRPSLGLAAIALLSPLVLFAWKIFWSARFEGALDRWPTRPGFRCLALSLAIGVPPLLALLAVRRATNAVHPSLAGMSVGVGAGLAAATLVDVWCPVAYAPHLLLGHLVPICVLALGGAWMGSKWLAS